LFLACLGSDFLLKDQKLAFTLQKPFQYIFDRREKVEEELIRFEPTENALEKANLETFASRFPVLSG